MWKNKYILNKYRIYDFEKKIVIDTCDFNKIVNHVEIKHGVGVYITIENKTFFLKKTYRNTTLDKYINSAFTKMNLLEYYKNIIC